ncbi:hypothetical protein KM043_018392 [Ampulex compressa]|nr:hypothetical protein KM043_018392 [Ampulex compressa]
MWSLIDFASCSLVAIPLKILQSTSSIFLVQSTLSMERSNKILDEFQRVEIETGRANEADTLSPHQTEIWEETRGTLYPKRSEERSTLRKKASLEGKGGARLSAAIAGSKSQIRNSIGVYASVVSDKDDFGSSLEFIYEKCINRRRVRADWVPMR